MNYAQAYRAIVKVRGFPPDPQVARWWQNEAGRIATATSRADTGAAHESHIRDVNVMARCVARAQSDLLPCAAE
jgi:hypothetical protein